MAFSRITELTSIGYAVRLRKMNKETHDILITLVLPRYEVMSIITALRRWTDIEDRKGHSSSNIKALADKIFAITREQFVAFEQKQSDHIPLSQRNPYE